MAGNFAAGRWSAQYGVDTMIRRGVVITSIGAAVGMALILLQPDGGPIVIATPQFIIAFASGFLLPNAIAGAVSVRPQAAGTAAGITGFMQMGLGALVAQLLGHLIAGAATALPLELIVLVLAACSMASLALIRK
jgi:DHA1 family bicyclomycin/chloramphenicol resistance-like MFS transporter